MTHSELVERRCHLTHSDMFQNTGYLKVPENLLDTVYLKESKGVMVHEDGSDGLAIIKRHKSICHNKPREMLLVKAYSLPGFPLQPVSLRLLLFAGKAQGPSLQALGAHSHPWATPRCQWDLPSSNGKMLRVSCACSLQALVRLTVEECVSLRNFASGHSTGHRTSIWN